MLLLSSKRAKLCRIRNAKTQLDTPRIQTPWFNPTVQAQLCADLSTPSAGKPSRDLELSMVVRTTGQSEARIPYDSHPEATFRCRVDNRAMQARLRAPSSQRAPVSSKARSPANTCRTTLKLCRHMQSTLKNAGVGLFRPSSQLPTAGTVSRDTGWLVPPHCLKSLATVNSHDSAVQLCCTAALQTCLLLYVEQS